jgi:hypothetical protein
MKHIFICWTALIISGIFLGQIAAQPPAAPSHKIKDAWEKAGAGFRWIMPRLIRRGTDDNDDEVMHPAPGELPCFVIHAKEMKGVLKTLPSPDVPFAIQFDGGDQILRELPSFALLRSLLPTEGPGGVTDAGLKELARFPQLEVMHLDFNRVTNAGLKELVACKNLHSLSLNGCEALTDQGLKELSGLANFRHLDIGFNRQLTGAHLGGLKELQSLAASLSGMNDEGARALGGLKKLQYLVMGSCPVTDKGRQGPERAGWPRRIALPRPCLHADHK